MSQPKILALFDLDHTLLPIDSDYEWGQFLVKVGAVSAQQFEADNQRLMDSYNAGTLEATESLPILLAPLAAHAMSQLLTWHEQFMQEVIVPNIKPAAKALVAKHMNAGHECVLVTATNSFVVGPIAKLFGFSHVLATQPEIINHQFTGAWVGTPCFKAGKVINLTQWLTSRGVTLEQFDESWFYSDSSNDLALLNYVSHPVACNPSASLEQSAIEHGWRIIRLWG